MLTLVLVVFGVLRRERGLEKKKIISEIDRDCRALSGTGVTIVGI